MVDRIIEKLAKEKESAENSAANATSAAETKPAKVVAAGAVISADAVSISGAAASSAQKQDKPDRQAKRQRREKTQDKAESYPEKTDEENASNGKKAGDKKAKPDKSKKAADDAPANDAAPEENREERQQFDFNSTAAKLLANLRYLDEVNKTRQRPAQPTFRGTVDAVARVNRMPKSVVADALRRLIENGVITQYQQTVGGNPDVKVISVDWAAAESYEAPNRPDSPVA